MAMACICAAKVASSLPTAYLRTGGSRRAASESCFWGPPASPINATAAPAWRSARALSSRGLPKAPAQVVREPAAEPAVLPGLDPEPEREDQGERRRERRKPMPQGLPLPRARCSRSEERAEGGRGAVERQEDERDAEPGRERVVLLAQRAPGGEGARRQSSLDARDPEAGPEARHSGAERVEGRAEAPAQERLLRGDDGPVLQPEGDGDDGDPPWVVGDEAEAERDEEVAEVERVARVRVRPARIELRRDQGLVLARRPVGDLADDPRAQGLAERAGGEPERRPEGRVRGAAAAPEERQERDQERHGRERAEAEERAARAREKGRRRCLRIGLHRRAKYHAGEACASA